MNQSYALYKKNPNKRAHDLNKEIKNTQTATTGFFFLLALISIFQLFFNDPIFIFHARRRNSKTKIKW